MIFHGGKMSKKQFHIPPYQREEILQLQDLQSSSQTQSWGVSELEVNNIWASSQGNDVVVAIIDTGVDTDHPDLQANLLTGYNVLSPSDPPEDDNEHGTHCSGIVAAINNSVGVVGVAPQAKILPIKVLDSEGSGDFDAIVTGIEWAIDNGADIISMSLGASSGFPAIRNALLGSKAANIPVFCAAGNSGVTPAVDFPARYPTAIAIGSINQQLQRSNFSNTGKGLDFMAPGSGILSTVPDGYAVFSGTSMATPFAAGLAALVLSYARANSLTAPTDSSSWATFFANYTTRVSGLKESMLAKKVKRFTGQGIIDPRKLLDWFQA